MALKDSKDVHDYLSKRDDMLSSQLVKSSRITHTISVTDNGDIDKVIEESEFDYEVEGRIMAGRKKAVTKIAKWWRVKYRDIKNGNNPGNYFQKTVSEDNRLLT